MTLTSLPFPPSGGQEPLAKNAPAPQQFSRLLDALLVLDAQRSCRVADLAAQVGLSPGRMRELLSAFMVAGADALGPDAPFNLDFGTDRGSLSADTDDDDAQAGAQTVHLSSLRGPGEWLLGDVGRRPVMVRDVARVLLAARLLLEGGLLPAEQQQGVEVLATKLSAVMKASVTSPAESAASVLQAAVVERQRVRFRYLHPWTGASEVVEVAPYAVRRRRDRLVLDAAGEVPGTYDLGGVSDVERIGAAGVFVRPDLPATEDGVAVVLRVTASPSAERWLLEGWDGRVVGPAGPGEVDVRILVDGNAGDPAVAQRLGVLLLQLGPVARVVSPESLRAAAGPVGRRLLEAHGG